tara:strand:+ start:529 stop:654 length:126 start_codon:yes stop_codon:yes gene_type:complete
MTLSPVEFEDVQRMLVLANDKQLKWIVNWIIEPMTTPESEL